VNGAPITFPHLNKAPIVEAIIDFRVRLPADFDIARFKALHSQFQADYPHVEDKKLVEHKFEHTLGKQPSHSVKDHGTHGYFFRSTDNANVVQFSRNGFTFNRLKPYTSWEEVFPEAARFWKLYVETSAPIDIPRIAVRYINRLMLPGPQLEFSEYLAAPPALPGGPASSLATLLEHPKVEGAPRFVSGFVSRVVINDPESDITAAVVQALEPPSEDRYIPVILDIDVFQENVSNLSPDDVLTRFEKLREMKNRAFFGSITDKTLEMVK
jgi:uncharacterized protein (TIGR04255 family)